MCRGMPSRPMSSPVERALPPSTSPDAHWLAPVADLLALLPMLGFWWWQGRPVAIADAPSSRVPCVSFAPYAGSQTPFDETLVLPPEQIERDLARLASLTDCVRTYSVDQGLDQVPAIAQRLGIKVLLGAWIGREHAKNEAEIVRVIELANRYPDTVAAVIVGNEVLLRREQPAGALAVDDRAGPPGRLCPGHLRRCLGVLAEESRQVGEAVDFVTIHTLPYWEDQPTAIDGAVAHIGRIWQQIGREFPGQAHLHRRGRMAVGRADARRRLAQHRQPGALRARDDGAGGRPGHRAQRDRELRPAVEAPSGGNRRRPLGLARRAAAAEVRARPARSATIPAGSATSVSPPPPVSLLLVPALLSAPRLRAGAWLGLALGAAAAGSLARPRHPRRAARSAHRLRLDGLRGPRSAPAGWPPSWCSKRWRDPPGPPVRCRWQL